METVRIETAHNVALTVQVATIVDRGLAVVIDWLVLAGWTVGWIILANEAGLHFPDWVWIILIGVPWTFYHLLSELLMDGQSLGKRARNIKVARLDGGQPGIGHFLLRWTLRLVDSLFFLGALVILLNGKGQRLGDIAAGTSVVSLRRRVKLSDALGPGIQEERDPVFPDAARLTDTQARLIREVLADRSGARQAALRKLADHFTPLFPKGQGMEPEAFLQALVADHAFLTSR